MALVGSSGVGKSSMVNALAGLAPDQLQQTGSIREHDAQGRHTTTSRSLHAMSSGGWIIDTPGMRELALWAGPASLDSTFSDVAQLSQGCRFRDCAHGVEAGCAVQAAILEEKLAPERWQSYQKLHAEIAWQERKIDITAALKEKQRWKKIHKAMRSPKRW